MTHFSSLCVCSIYFSLYFSLFLSVFLSIFLCVYISLFFFQLNVFFFIIFLTESLVLIKRNVIEWD
ncbi:hypothetical protein EJD97_020820 [Solanum chilense]|uniref:Uncharacterized protein n=1 Tax=Solanum chilense TaxID=4083 RepID=A0A6N2AWG6_SOLCI|nr:hypothetical protein EJD97_020820 [Solanum chilense]